MSTPGATYSQRFAFQKPSHPAPYLVGTTPGLPWSCSEDGQVSHGNTNHDPDLYFAAVQSSRYSPTRLNVD